MTHPQLHEFFLFFIFFYTFTITYGINRYESSMQIGVGFFKAQLPIKNPTSPSINFRPCLPRLPNQQPSPLRRLIFAYAANHPCWVLHLCCCLLLQLNQLFVLSVTASDSHLFFQFGSFNSIFQP